MIWYIYMIVLYIWICTNQIHQYDLESLWKSCAVSQSLQSFIPKRNAVPASPSLQRQEVDSAKTWRKSFAHDAKYLDLWAQKVFFRCRNSYTRTGNLKAPLFVVVVWASFLVEYRVNSEFPRCKTSVIRTWLSIWTLNFMLVCSILEVRSSDCLFVVTPGLAG